MTFNPSQFVDQSGNPTDTSLVALAKSIKTVESSGDIHAVGKSGEKGAYQWMPGNFESGAKKYGFDPTDRSDVNQNKVAYMQMAEMKAKGLQPYQIASSWNSGSPDNWQNHSGTNDKGVKYDTPAYVKNVMAEFTKARGASDIQTPPPTDPNDPMGGKTFAEMYSSIGGNKETKTKDTQSGQENGALFPSVTGESPIMAGVKTLGNILPSAFNFAKGVVSSVNPVNIAKTVSQIPGAFSDLAQQQGGVGNAIKAAGKEFLPEAYKATVPAFGRDLIAGDTEAAQRDVTNNPFGSIAPFVFAAEGGAKFADNLKSKAEMADYVKNIGPESGPIPKPSTTFSDMVNKPMEAVTDTVTKPVRAFSSFVADNVPKMAKYAFGQATGLEPSTIETRINNPKADMSTVSREGIASTIKEALDKREEDLSETGKGYKTIRAQETPIEVDKNFLRDQIIKETGVEIDKKGNIKTSGSATLRDASDINRLQKFHDFWQPYFKKGELTADEYLNMRKDLADLSKFDNKPGRSGPLESTAKGLRANLNDTYRSQIKGLEDADATFSSQKTELDNLRKGVLDKEGNLTKGAPNAIANSLGKGKAAFASQLDEISPGIAKKVQILKMAEDFEHAAGTKVGTYSKALGTGLTASVFGGGIVGVAAGLAEAILASPAVADFILRKYGENKPLLKAIAEKLKSGAQTVNNITDTSKSVFGKPVTRSLEKMGLSIEDITKKGEKTSVILPSGEKVTGTIIDVDPRTLKPSPTNGNLYNETSKGYANGDAITINDDGSETRVQHGKLSDENNTLPPIIIDKKGNIIDGNNRFAASAIANLKTIKAIVVDSKNPFGKQTSEMGLSIDDVSKKDESAIPKELAQEAKKYKSAEEFVKENNPVISELETAGGEKRVIIDLFPNDLVKGKGITKNQTLDVLKDAYEKDHTIIEPSNGMWSKEGKGFIQNLENKGYVKQIENRGGIERYGITSKINQWETKSQLTDIWNKVNKKSNFGK